MNEIRITTELSGGHDAVGYRLTPTGAGLVSRAAEHAGFPARDEWPNELAAAIAATQSVVTLWAKRAMDVILALVLLLVAWPVMIFVALAVLLEGGGPVLIAHERIGRFGRPFRCLKFRTMVVDADKILAHVLAEDPHARAEWAARRKLRRDPRVTVSGSILRSSSLDELPQLLNVLRGEMSLVGPRPVVRSELTQHYGEVGAAHYLSVRPGLTGPWQVSGRSDTSYDRRVLLDTDYVLRLSVIRDFMFLLKTVFAVLVGRGAY
jgi:lipopolysaccharide/colanic/teichoic acid biosynthesis glycosyltransferase